MIPLATRVQDVASIALALDVWTRVAIRDRLADLSADRPDLKPLLSAAAAYLAAVSDSGEQAENTRGVLLYLMPPEPLRFTGVLALEDEFGVLREAVALALRQQDNAVGNAAQWWTAFAHALAAAAAALQDAAELGRFFDDPGLE